MGVLEQQAKCVAIAGDRLWTDMFVLKQVFDKKGLQHGSD
jgi:hypothetical protein